MSRLAAADLVRSEWTKFRSLRSSLYTILVTVVLAVGLGALITHGIAGNYADMSPDEQASFDPTNNSLYGCFFVAQLAIGVLGVLAVTSEYATGMLRTSLAAVPRRGRLLAAKAAVLAAVAFVVGQVASFGAFAAGQPIFAALDAPHAALDQPHVFRAVFGAGLWLALVGLLGMALGVIVRATGGALALLVGATLLMPLLAEVLPGVVEKYWPTLAGLQITTVVRQPDTLPPWAGFGVMVAAVAATFAVAYALFRRRDA